MQLYAFDQKRQVIFARDASRQMDYFCPECSGVLRLRGGVHRQNHFYHLETTRNCRQSGKSIEHLNVQLYFLSALPIGECILEMRFPEISRIADIYWADKKIVFEVQCSPISRQEVQERSKDYQSLGFEVIWVLHDKRYNQKRSTSAEDFLHHRPHYFTNIDEGGAGIIYDQFSQLDKGYRINCMPPLAIDVSHPKWIEKGAKFEGKMLNLIERRLKASSGYFANDLADHFFNSVIQNDYLEKALELEISSGLTITSNTLFKRIKFLFCQYIIRPYQLLFQLLLEKACK